MSIYAKKTYADAAQPVGSYFANTTDVCDKDTDPGAHNCVVPLLMKVSESQTIKKLQLCRWCTGT